jgi:REP element-mobilizing transposase RayT
MAALTVSGHDQKWPKKQIHFLKNVIDASGAGLPGEPATGRRRLRRRRHNVGARLAAKTALHYPPVVFDSHQALTIAHGFAEQIATSGYVVHACSILPQHVHMVIARHHYRIESVVRLLKAQASAHLEADGRHPFLAHRRDGALPSPWARKCWKVFLNTDEDITRAIPYVENNPRKEGKRRQRWSFVTPYVPEPTPNGDNV